MTDYEYPTTEDQINAHVLALLKEVITKSNERSANDEVSRALLYFLLRVANTWRSIRTLLANTPDGDGCLLDAGVLLRAMFDAYLQAEYMVHAPDAQSERAKAYLDYEIVERYKMATKILAHDHPLSDRLKSSPARATGEKARVAEYDRVKDRYFIPKRQKDGTIKRGPGTRDRWYEGNLRKIAHDIGKEVEHDFFVATFHGCVHSSAFAIHEPHAISPQYVLPWASKFAARVARINVVYNEIVLDDFRRQLLEGLCRSTMMT